MVLRWLRPNKADSRVEARTLLELQYEVAKARGVSFSAVLAIAERLQGAKQGLR